ncbi:MAG: DUF4145 domain-containing protein [Lachnospiraceae bacterium]|nr:DUF4145 domain-containing protein [Lachnospiraceae bacterium]
MPDSFTCPYCQKEVAISESTYSEHWMSASTFNMRTSPPKPGQLRVSYYICPSCKKIMITASVDHNGELTTVNIEPPYLAKQFPNYVPEPVRQDYEEACSIVDLSPKASATLSRRCLQGIIRDFWGIYKNRLVDEIDALEGKVPATQWKILNSLRRIGNIGAHPEADVNLIIEIRPEDAKKLISVIEILISQWYIERHEQEKLYDDILAFDNETKSRKAKE